MTSNLKPATAAAAKSLQSCPTLCDPIDSSPPGSPLPGILQARTLEWVAISFSKAKAQSLAICIKWLHPYHKKFQLYWCNSLKSWVHGLNLGHYPLVLEHSGCITFLPKSSRKVITSIGIAPVPHIGSTIISVG